MEDEDLNSIFEDPGQEEVVILPNAEVSENDTDGSENNIDPEEKELSYQEEFDSIIESETSSDEFIEPLQTLANMDSLEIETSFGSKINLAQVEVNQKFNRNTGLFNVDNFKNEAQRSRAIIFNNRIIKQKEEYQATLEPYSKISAPGIETSFEGLNTNQVYKWEIGEGGEFEYYYKENKEDEDWIKQENKKGATYIQSYFEHAINKEGELITSTDLDQYYLLKNFSNNIYDTKSANDKAIKAQEEGLIGDPNLDNISEDDPLAIVQAVTGADTDAIYKPQDKELTSDEWSYQGDTLDNNQLESIGYNSENSLKVFENIYSGLSNIADGDITLNELGINLNSFLRYVEESGTVQGGLNKLLENHYESLQNNENKYTAENQSTLINALQSYVTKEVEFNKMFLINNYFKNNLNNPKYVKMIKEINQKQAEGDNGVLSMDQPDKVNLINWVNYQDLFETVTSDMWKEGGFNNLKHMDGYLTAGTLIDTAQVNKYLKTQFPEYTNFWQEQLAIKLENKSKGDEETSWLKEFGGSMTSRLEGWSQGVLQNLSYSAGYLNMNETAKWLNQDDEIWRTMVDENLEGYQNLRPEGFYTGKTAVVDDVKYALTKDGQIIDTSDDLFYVVDTNSEESILQGEKIRTALEKSNDTESFYSLDNTRIGMAKVFGYLTMDIIGTIGTRKGANVVGLTNKFKRIARNRFKFSPKSVNLISGTVNTMAYYGISGTMDGYIQNYKLALANDIDPEDAHKLAQGAAWRQGIWYAGSSIFVPQSAYNKIPHAVSGFRNKTQQALNAYKKSGYRGFDNYWRGQFAKMNPTSRAVVTRLYDFGKTGIGETAQELTQEVGTKKWINNYINDIAQKKIVSEDFTFDEIMNTGIYSFIAGGTAGMLGSGSKINTNSQEYLQNLLYLGKEPTKLQTMLNKMVAGGEITNSLSKELMSDVIAVTNQSFKMPTFIKSQNVLEAAKIMEKIDGLNRQKKDFGGNFKGFDNQIKDLQVDLNLLYASDLDIGNQKIANQIGYEYIEGNTATIEQKISELKKSDPNANVDNSIGFGAFVTANGKQYALIDTMKSARKNFFTTGQHEGFHGLLAALVRRDPTSGGRLGSALLKEVKKGINKGTIKLNNNEFGIRFQQYVNDSNISDNVVLEEIMPLLSEALTRGGVTIQETTGGKIGDALRRFAASFGINLGFKNGKDVLNLVRDYNRAVESGRGLSKGLQNLAQDKGTFGLGQTTVSLEQANTDTLKRGETNQNVDQKSSKDLETLIDDFKSGDVDVDVESLTTQYQKLGKDALKRWAAQRGVTINLGDPRINEEVTSLLNKEFNSFMRNFDSSKSSVSTYMNNIAKRIGPVLVEEGTRKGKQVSQDVLAEKGVSLETTTQPDVDAKTQPTGKRAKVFPNSVKVIADNITGEIRGEQIVMLKNDITEAILRVGTDPKKVAKYIVEKTKTKEYRAVIKKALGPFGTEQYIDNVIKLFRNNTFIKSIPVANIKRRFGKLFGIKQTGETPTIKIENGKRTDFKKQVYSIPAITSNKLAQVRQYFLADEKRHQSLMSLIGEGVAVEAMNEISTDQEFMNNLQGRLEFRDSNLSSEEFMAELEFSLDKRNLEDTSLDNVKLSKDTNIDPLKIKDYQRINLLIKDNPKALLRKAGYNPYPSFGKGAWSDSFTAEQKQQRNQAVVRLLPKLGLDFFNSYGWFKNNSAVFKDKTEFDSFINSPLDPDFVNNNAAVKKITKKINNQYFIDKNKVPKEGSLLTKSEWKTVKKARTEQATYATLPKSKRNSLLKNDGFRKLQDNKVKALKKIVTAIDKDVRDKDGNIIAERFEFYAAWLESQANVSTHAVRVLSPIRFFSTSSIPFTTPVLKVRKKDNTIVQGGLKNYEAEHMLPVNNATRAILDMIINNNVDKDFQFIASNSIQGQLLKTDDNIITKAGYQTKLPRDFFDMKKPNAWIRYLLGNPTIDLNSYVMFDTNTNKIVTVAESLGLPLAKIDQNPDSINFQNNLLVEVLLETKTVEEARVELKKSNEVDKSSSKQVIINQETLFPLLNKKGNTESTIKAFNDADETGSRARKYSKETKGISVFDFDDTLAFSESKVLVKMPDGSINKITPAEFANQAEDLELNGAKFDFSEFNKVVNGRKGPLADLALKRQNKFGSGDIFVLTARPQLSAVAIKKFLDGIGLNLPLQNITGLENGSPEAKALWVLDKTAQGYNNFYFADDALPNVQAVKNILDQVDVKSKVQQAKASKEIDLDKEFNVIIEQQSGKEWFKEYSNARATVEGKKANKFEFFIPPSAEDFVGLMYKVLPKGDKGNLAMRWINDNLLDPFNKAEQNVISAKMSVANDFKSLRDSIDDIPKNLMEESGYSNFTWSQALRVYIWNMQNENIPGLSTRDQNSLVNLISKNPSMKIFAEKIAFIQKGKSYPVPRDTWVGGSITSDIIDGIQKVYRKEALAEWQQNVDIIFSKKNMNKLEALYGSNFTFALKNMLGRMKRGSNRTPGSNPQVDNVIDWVNNSVGTTMFLNRKSALLQLISNVNYLNWSDNNIIEAGKAFANQKQYWTDVSYLLNSDYLVQRRNGLKINVAESEIAEASKKGGFKGVVAMLLNKGFVFTRFADSLAIATGGATFYRNRLNKLQTKVNPDTGKLYTKKQAESVAFNDFYKISEETQQSSRTDRISMQQASGLGRIILNYANTPMQYARIIKKATKDLLAGRGDAKTNISKIVYYGTVQNLIFNSLQQALFALAFTEDDEDPKQDRTVSDKATNIGFGMLSSLLRGLGYGGALVDTLISVSREISWGKDGLPTISEDAVFNIADFSPTIDTKIRKFRAIQKTFRYNRKEIKRRGFSIENPAYYAFAQVIDAGFNVPLDRALRMVMTIKQASDRDTQLWQRFALLAGFSSWSLGLPYWGTTTTVGEEAAEDEAIKVNYKKESIKLKKIGYKRIPMTRGKPDGKLNEDFIEVTRPSGDTEYWLIPKIKIK